MATSPTYQIGSTGQGVKDLQTKLIGAGYKIGADGVFGNQTANAVKQYQKANGLISDGIAGQHTIGKLYGGGTMTTPGFVTPSAPKPGTMQLMGGTKPVNTVAPKPGMMSTLTAPKPAPGTAIPGSMVPKVNIGTNWNYNSTPSTGDLQTYVNDQLKQKQNTENLGYNQIRDTINGQIGHLNSDKYIQDYASNMGNVKYADQFTNLANQGRLAQTDRNNQYMDLMNSYNQGVGQLKGQMFNEQQGNMESANARGLYNSSILDQLNAGTQRSGNSNLAQMHTDTQTQLNQLDNNLNTLMQNLEASKGTLTKSQQTEISQMINDMMKERNDKRDSLNQQVTQNEQSRLNAFNGLSSEGNKMFQDLYGQMYDKNYQKTRDGVSDSQWQKDYALRQQQLALDKANGGRGGSGGGYSLSSTSNPPAGGDGGPSPEEIKAIQQHAIQQNREALKKVVTPVVATAKKIPVPTAVTKTIGGAIKTMYGNNPFVKTIGDTLKNIF